MTGYSSPQSLQTIPTWTTLHILPRSTSWTPVTRAQLKSGNWDIVAKGEMFKREWFDIVDEVPKCTRYMRWWDCAATEQVGNNDPDWSVGILMGVLNGVYYIIDVQRFQKSPGESDEHMSEQKLIDGRGVAIREEQEPGSAGKKIISIHSRGIFEGYDYLGISSSGDKVTRAKPFSAACQNGNVKLMRAHWNNEFLWELEMFPQKGVHDDQVDGASSAYSEMSLAPKKKNPIKFNHSVMAAGGTRI